MRNRFLLPPALILALLILTTTCYAETRQEAVNAELDQYQNPQLMKLVGFEESKRDCKYPPSMDPVFEDGRITGWVVTAAKECKE